MSEERPATLAPEPLEDPQGAPHVHDWGGFDRSICPVCDGMHTYCIECGMNDCPGDVEAEEFANPT